MWFDVSWVHEVGGQKRALQWIFEFSGKKHNNAIFTNIHPRYIKINITIRFQIIENIENVFLKSEIISSRFRDTSHYLAEMTSNASE